MKPRHFEMGQLLITPGARKELTVQQQLDALYRHRSCDWSDMSKDDERANLKALDDGSRIFGAYDIEGKRVWIITEAKDDDGHRSATTILLPDEY